MTDHSIAGQERGIRMLTLMKVCIHMDEQNRRCVYIHTQGHRRKGAYMSEK